MRICRFSLENDETVRTGVVIDGAVHDVSAIDDDLPALRWPLSPGDHFIRNLDRLRPRLHSLAKAAPAMSVDEVRLKCPVANPGKFVCGAGNSQEVVRAGGHPRQIGLLFKMISAAGGASDGVTLRWPERTTVHEMELAIIIGKSGTEIAAADAMEYVAGYAMGLDMTMQGKEFPSFGKSFDTYGVIGPWLVTADEIPDPSALNFCLTVNGEVRQADAMSHLVLDVAHLIEHVSSIMTIHPGDVIFSGTPPSTVGPVSPGDVMHARMDAIGEMTVQVRGGGGRKTPVD